MPYLQSPQLGSGIGHALRAQFDGRGIDIELTIRDNGRIEWTPRSSPLLNHMIHMSAEPQELNARVAEFGKNHSVLVDARRLPMSGKKEEAAQLLKDYIASKPGDEHAKQAQALLE